VTRLLGVIGAAALLGLLVALVLAIRRRRLIEPGFLLQASGLLSVAVFSFTTRWLLALPGSTPGDDVRTGGLAAAAVLALYGLWLNDRRRRTEEERSATERMRFAQERERTAGERFAQAIELLGHDDEAVKLGALHSLASIAGGWPDLAQAVLDVFCAYLRMPSDATQAQRGPRLLQVRRTAQRLVRQTLTANHGDPDHHLDLTGAELDGFTLDDVAVATIELSGAVCSGSTTLRGLVVTDRFVLTGARFTGRVDASNARINTSEAHSVRFQDGLVARGLACDHLLDWQVECDRLADFTDARFHGGLRLHGSTFQGSVTLQGAFLGEHSDFDDVTLESVDLRVIGQPADFDPQRLVTTAAREHVRLPPWLELVPGQGTRSRIRRTGRPALRG
jgi:hypothetical protein